MTQDLRSDKTLFGNVIYAYTRRQALLDGVLIDVTNLAREAGFHLPVAMTAAAWARCIAWREADNARQTPQDEAGRLWDVLWMAARTARHAQGNRCTFEVYQVPRDGRSTHPQPAVLHLHVGPGDAGEPVITILLPNED